MGDDQVDGEEERRGSPASTPDAGCSRGRTGRTPRVQDLGLDTVGVDVAKGLSVDDHCRFGDGLWAVGDVTGEAMFTHVAKYQGRVAADNILGRPRVARYDGIPRVIFADPEIAAVGLTSAQARQRRIDVAAAEVSLPKSIARPWTYETDPRGALGLLADRSQGCWSGRGRSRRWPGSGFTRRP